MERFDAIVIGTGQAGPSLAAKLAEAGKKVAIIEKAKLGGTCVNDGCTPTKTYVASARRAWIARNSSELGVSTKKIEIDLKRIKERKDDIISDSRDGLQKMFEENENITLYRGRGQFKDNRTVIVDGEQLRAQQVFINTGARARIPDEYRDIPFLTNTGMLELEEIPEHLIVVGGGPVGLEFSQLFRRFGSRVSIIEHSEKLLEREDEDVSQEMEQLLKNEGIEFHFNSKQIKAEELKDGIRLQFISEDKKMQVTGSHVLIAAGRIPNTDKLGLDQTDINIDEKGYIEVNEHCETNVKGIFAMGDCNGRGAFTHTSYNDFQIVNSFLLEDGSRSLSDRYSCYAIYTDPPLARVGMNEQQIKEKGRKILKAKMAMSKIARAKEKGETRGFIKVLVDRDSEQFLGATFLGIDADEYIHTIIDQMYAGNSYKVIRDAVHIHPTVSELIPTLLENLEPLN